MAIQRRYKTYLGLREKRPILTEFGLFRQIFMKVSNIKFDRNPSSGNWADTCRRTDMNKLIGASRDYANASERGNHAQH
jgi:hypothetical protein